MLPPGISSHVLALVSQEISVKSSDLRLAILYGAVCGFDLCPKTGLELTLAWLNPER